MLLHAQHRRRSSAQSLASAVLAATLVVTVVGGPALAQTPATRAAATTAPAIELPPRTTDVLEGRTVAHVEVFGLVRGTSEAVLANSRIIPGQAYARQQIEVEIRRIASSQQFLSVKGEVVPTADGRVVVRIVVEERPVINAVEITGNRHKKDEDLRDLIITRAGSTYDAFSVEQDRTAVVNAYRKDGYPNVRVDIDKDAWEKHGTLRFAITEGAKTRIKKVQFEGNTHLVSSFLKWKINTKTYFWFFQKGVVDEDTVAGDEAIIKNEYLRRGYLDARVSHSYEYTADKSRVTVRFLINEGPRYRIGKINITGSRVYPDWELQADLVIKPGQWVDRDMVERSQKHIEDRYGHDGYIYRTVDVSTAYSETLGVVDLNFVITENNPYTVGQIIIRGNTNIQDRVIRRQIRIYPDQTYDSVLVKKSIDRIKGARIFSDAKITPVGDHPTIRYALVEVVEGQTGKFSVGAGVSTNSGLVGQVSIEQSNFDITNFPRSGGEFLAGQSFKGQGQFFRILLEPGTELQRYRITFEEPSLFDTAYSFGNDAYYFTRGRESYNERRIGDVVTFGRHFGDVWAASLGFRLEQVTITHVTDGNDNGVSDENYFLQDPTTGQLIGPHNDSAQQIIDQKGSHLLTSIKPGISRNTTDSNVFPTTGSRASLFWEQYGAVGGDVTMSKIVARYDWYYPLYTDLFDRKTVFIQRNEVGVIPAGNSVFYERFYGGGIGSLRGFKFRGISPREGGLKDPVGGDFSWLSTGEVNFPIFEQILRGVVFVDVGTVETDITISSIRADVGAGVRITIPFFGQLPLALDFAMPVSKASGDRTQIISFALGIPY